MNYKILTVLGLIMSVQFASAQAYDGMGDSKIFAGYANVGGVSGVDVQYDFGLSDLISLGAKMTILSKPDDREIEDNFDRSVKAFDAVNFGFYMRFHFSETLNLSEKIDPFAGFDFSSNSLGPHIGCKYNFSEVIGGYVQYSHSVSSSLAGDHVVVGETYGHYDDNINYFGKKSAIAFGITFNLF